MLFYRMSGHIENDAGLPGRLTAECPQNAFTLGRGQNPSTSCSRSRSPDAPGRLEGLATNQLRGRKAVFREGIARRHRKRNRALSFARYIGRHSESFTDAVGVGQPKNARIRAGQRYQEVNLSPGKADAGHMAGFVHRVRDAKRMAIEIALPAGRIIMQPEGSSVRADQVGVLREREKVESHPRRELPQYRFKFFRGVDVLGSAAELVDQVHQIHWHHCGRAQHDALRPSFPFLRRETAIQPAHPAALLMMIKFYERDLTIRQ